MQSLALFLLFFMLAGCSSLPFVDQYFAASDESKETLDDNSKELTNNQSVFTQSGGIVDVNDAYTNNAANNTYNQSNNMPAGSVDAFGSMVQPAKSLNNGSGYKRWYNWIYKCIFFWL